MVAKVSRRSMLGGMAGALVLGAGSGTARAATATAAVTGSGGSASVVSGTSATSNSSDAELYFPVPSVPGGGPLGTDRVQVLAIGPTCAETVLVLVPGMLGAANDFRLMARDLVAAVPGLQVWAVDRREQDLADLSHMADSDRIDYYLGGHYRSQDPADSAYVGGWGLSLTVQDLRQVVLAASAGGRRRVVLGGHSFGATTALAYAAWDFDGRPGYRDVAGLCLIDGGVHGAWAGEGQYPQNSPEQVKERLAAIAAGGVFDLSLVPVGVGTRPESTQIWYQLAGWYAHTAPDEQSVLQPHLPDALQVPFPITNAALLGMFVDESFGWPKDISVHSGHFATDGAVRGWVDDGITPISRVAAAYAGPSPVVWEWYWPERLSVDLDVIDPYTDTELARSLGLRLYHASELNIPLYAFATSTSNGTVLSSAEWVVANSRIPSASYATDDGMDHLDPLFAATDKNTATQTMTEFLIRGLG